MAKIPRICPAWLVIRDNRPGFGAEKFRTYRDSYEIERYPDYRDPGWLRVSMVALLLSGFHSPESPLPWKSPEF